MKRLVLLSIMVSALPLTILAQDDDMYFVPTKKNVQKSKDEYYRHNSYYEPIANDSPGNDIIDFNNEIGVYPDSLSEDFALTRQMSRWDGYTPSDAYWEGYDRGRSDGWSVSVWHSPWYYSSYYPWYDSYWYDPWYYTPWSWHVGYYDPWYYRYYRLGWGGYYSYRPYNRYHHSAYVNRSRRSSIGAGTINRYGYTHNSSASSRSSVGSMRGNTNTVNPNRNRSANSINSMNNSSRSSVGSSSPRSNGGFSRSGSMNSGSRSGSMGSSSRGGGSMGRRH